MGDDYAPYVRASLLPTDLAVRVLGMPANGEPETDYDVSFELTYHPRLDYSLLTPGSKFELIEGSRVVGRGIVLSSEFSSSSTEVP